MDEANFGNDEPRWHASLAVIAALALYVTLPPKVTFGPLWLVPLLVLLILVPLSIISPMRHHETPRQRLASMILIGLLNLFNILSLVLLVVDVLHPHHVKIENGTKLLTAGIQIWFTNILVFGLWYWELDGGGPEARAHCKTMMQMKRADFLFPQMQLGNRYPDFIHAAWKPLFIDYLFLAFTNASAFSPADTFPLTRLGKVLMMAESLTSFVTIGIIISRAVGIIG